MSVNPFVLPGRDSTTRGNCLLGRFLRCMPTELSASSLTTATMMTVVLAPWCAAATVHRCHVLKVSGGVNAPRGSALFETIVPVYICWFFTFIELCCVCVLLLPVNRKRKPAAKRRTKGAGQNGVWRHDGFHSSRFRAAKHDAETHAERLMFHYKVSLKMHGHFKVRAGDHSISLHDIVTGDHDQATKNMYAGALSDFMKCLLLTTPSAAAMEETLESTGLDPLGPLDADALQSRNKVYGNRQ